MLENQAKLQLRPSRIIGIDFGLARLGLAISDERKIIANSWQILTTERKTDATILKLLKIITEHSSTHQYEVKQFVIGMPLMMNGKKGMLADEVLHFISILKEHTQIPIVTWDERLSTVQADRSLREGHLSRKKRSKVVDGVAATIILQSYLDRINWDTPLVNSHVNPHE